MERVEGKGVNETDFSDNYDVNIIRVPYGSLMSLGIIREKGKSMKLCIGCRQL